MKSRPSLIATAAVALGLALSSLGCGTKTATPKSPTAAAAKKPDAAKKTSLASGAKSGSVSGGTKQADSSKVTVGGKEVFDTGESNPTWTVEDDIDGDGETETVTVVYDEKDGTTYLAWPEPLETDDCTDVGAVNMLIVKDSGEFTALVIATCDGQQGLYGCSFSADAVCQDCGTCDIQGDALQCSEGVACE